MSPGKAVAIANVIIAIASRTPISETKGARNRISRRRWTRCPPPSVVQSVSSSPLDEVRTVESLIADERRVDAHQRFGATFWFDAIIVWNAAACVSMSLCTALSDALYCASFFGENAVL